MVTQHPPRPWCVRDVCGRGWSAIAKPRPPVVQSPIATLSQEANVELESRLKLRAPVGVLFLSVF